MAGMPASRIGDMHVCPMVTGLVPHVGGPIAIGAPTVLTGSMPQARIGDMCVCVGPPDAIAMGAFTVIVSGSPAARIGDMTVHGGSIVVGFPTVIIGMAAGEGGGGGAVKPGMPGQGGSFEPASAADQGAAWLAGVRDPGHATGALGEQTTAGGAAGAAGSTPPVTYGKAIRIEGDAAFQKKVIADLDRIKKTEAGAKLLKDLDASGKTVTIKPTTSGNSVSLSKGSADWKKKADGTNGAGCDSTVNYDPDRDTIGPADWQKRPPAIGLAHELIHAQHAAEGSIDMAKVANDSKPDPADPKATALEKLEEVRTAGIPPHDKGDYTENLIRSQWDPKQPQRPWY